MNNYPGQPGGPVNPAPYSQTSGTTILVLGILSLVLCQILGPIAWAMGNNALRSNPDPSQIGTINGGRICGMIGTAFLIIGLLIGILWVIFFGGLAIIGATSHPHPSS